MSEVTFTSPTKCELLTLNFLLPQQFLDQSNVHNEAEQGEDSTVNYREMAQNLISQQLASANVDSFALIYNDGTAHFQGSNSAYDLSSIEPIDGANSTIESNENFDDQEQNPEIDWPFRFEN